MKPDTLMSLEDKNVEIKLNKKKFILPSKIQRKVDLYWEKIIRDNDRATRGEVFTIYNINSDQGSIKIDVRLSDYAHYIYTRAINLPEKYSCKNAHTSCIIETSDNFLVFGKMGKHTAIAGSIQCVGGGLDYDDVKGDEIDLVHSIKSELLEEVGVDTNDKSLIESFEMKYLRHNSKVHSLAIIFVLKLKISAKEFSDFYNEFEKALLKKDELPEFGELIYLPKTKIEVDKFYNKEKNNFDHYMKPLLDEMINY